jgi:glycosyltransferase involved in cell wall biosynthesis
LKKHVRNPKISVIIPTYNRVDDLRRCLNSLVTQTIDDFEVLVCDDGSTDNTSEVIKDYDSLLDITYDYEENFGGPARPRNRGIKLARAQYIAFLDSDDWWTPHKLELSFAVLSAGAEMVYHDLYLAQSHDQAVFNERIVSTEPKHPMFSRLLSTGISIPNSSVVVRRELLTQIGGQTEKRELISVEDYDTWIRLSRLTERFVRIPECLGYYWIGGGNISSASPIQCARIIALYEQYIGELKDADHRRALGFLAYRVGRIAQLYGDKAKAHNNLLEALFSPINFFYRIKAVYFLIVNILSKLFS